MADDNMPFITEVPIIEIRGTSVIVRARSGDNPREAAMGIKTFAKFMERGQRALREHAEGDKIILVDD